LGHRGRDSGKADERFAADRAEKEKLVAVCTTVAESEMVE
jgi:hypothetical protein